MARKSAIHRLEATREAIDVATKQITEVEAQRNAALLKDDDSLAGKLFGELESLRSIVQGHSDKVKLLEGEADRERAERIVREHQGLLTALKDTPRLRCCLDRGCGLGCCARVA